MHAANGKLTLEHASLSATWTEKKKPPLSSISPGFNDYFVAAALFSQTQVET